MHKPFLTQAKVVLHVDTLPTTLHTCWGAVKAPGISWMYGFDKLIHQLAPDAWRLMNKNLHGRSSTSAVSPLQKTDVQRLPLYGIQHRRQYGQLRGEGTATKVLRQICDGSCRLPHRGTLRRPEVPQKSPLSFASVLFVPSHSAAGVMKRASILRICKWCKAPLSLL